MQLAPHQKREQLYLKIDSRARQMLEDGLISETEGLISRYSKTLKALQTLGYREVLDFLAGELNAAQLLEKIAQHTRQYAKRQLTWFRKESEIIWVDSPSESGKVLRSIDKFLLL
jgi:tRNA dimethylallyltransferase